MSSADELAVLTAKNCFEHADLNHDDVLSKEEFEEWYNSSDGQDLHQVEQMAQDRLISQRFEDSPHLIKAIC